MKVRLKLTKDGRPLYSAVLDVSDSDGFGRACASAWEKIKQDRMAKETSVGAVMEHLRDDVIDQLNGAHISLERD